MKNESTNDSDSGGLRLNQTGLNLIFKIRVGFHDLPVPSGAVSLILTKDLS